MVVRQSFELETGKFFSRVRTSHLRSDTLQYDLEPFFSKTGKNYAKPCRLDRSRPHDNVVVSLLRKASKRKKRTSGLTCLRDSDVASRCEEPCRIVLLLPWLLTCYKCTILSSSSLPIDTLSCLHLSSVCLGQSGSSSWKILYNTSRLALGISMKP